MVTTQTTIMQTPKPTQRNEATQRDRGFIDIDEIVTYEVPEGVNLIYTTYSRA
jgi:hypothetical protein